jgi:hypothetical protein
MSVVENRGDHLENARHKYVFNDLGAPSFWLLEDEDDNGKQIEDQSYTDHLEWMSKLTTNRLR